MKLQKIIDEIQKDRPEISTHPVWGRSLMVDQLEEVHIMIARGVLAMYKSDQTPDYSRVDTRTMTPEELKAYIEALPKPPKKVREGDLATLSPQKGANGSQNKYRKTGGEYR